MTIGELLSYSSEAGFTGLFIAILWGGYKRVWVWGWQLDESKERERETKALLDQLVNVTDRQTNVAETIVQPSKARSRP